MAEKSKIVLLFGIILTLAGCANQMAPTGGEVDKIPPEIIESYPKNRATNFSEDFIELQFSEYVDKLSVQNAVFISPALQQGLTYDWSGKRVTIEFKDTLQLNTTYTVTIGTEVFDLNNRNKMVQPYVFAFSTGDKIDTAKISGKVYDSKVDGIMIYAYQTNGEIDAAKQKPNYVSQVGKNGNYSLVGLRNGEYKVIAVRDYMLDMLYQKNDDEFGVQSNKIELTPKNTSVEHVDFFLSREDTIAPKLSAAFMKDRNHLVIEFSEGIDSSKLSAANFELIDSVSQKKILPKHFYKYDLKPNQFYIAFEDTNSFKDYLLYANSFEDLNTNKTSLDKIGFVYKTEKDTTVNKLLKVYGEMPGDKVDFEKPIVKVQFVDGIDLDDVKSRTSIEDAKKNRIEFTAGKVDDALFNLNISAKLKPGTEYLVKFSAGKLKDLSFKSIDTVYQFKFVTTTELDFGGLSGIVVSDDSTLVTVIESVTSPKRVYQQKNDKMNKFDFRKVVPGKYLAWSYKDKNENGKYDIGSIMPFKYSEDFRFYNDTLNLRARWPVGDVIINFVE
ncbi:MAG: Ig-like domain-containing protein [Bacteroidota bacterium]